MAQHICDLFERGPDIDQMTREAVAQAMGARPGSCNTGAVICLSHRPVHDCYGKRCFQRWPVSHKERTVGALGLALLQILHDGLPRSGRDRQHVNALTFGASQSQRALSPIEILEFKSCYLSCA